MSINAESKANIVSISVQVLTRDPPKFRLHYYLRVLTICPIISKPIFMIITPVRDCCAWLVSAANCSTISRTRICSVTVI